MKRTRKTFLADAAAVGAVTLLGAAAAPKASPTASPTPSPGALEAARAMRRFDPNLSDEQIAGIARGIDEQNASAARIRKRMPLQNGNEPTPEFRVGS